MAKFLSEEWNSAVTGELNGSDAFKNASKSSQLTMQYVVSNTPDGEVKYWSKIDNGTYGQGLGDTEGADVTIQLDYDTAAKINKGELNPQAAFMQGKLKLAPGSNMGKLMQNLGVIQSMGPVLKNVDTEY